ncbi:MAG: thioredoxin domain-containing protein [Deltaproteobacteria bacterium]|nr:thioredoxin domain-containing protein [Deltaproteobacteria bacterium]
MGESAILGPKNAPNTLFVYSDFQCPFCARIQPLFDEVMRDATLKGEIKIVAKEFPLGFHKNARPAAKAALAAGNQGDAFYYKMSEKFYGHQKELSAENYSVWAKEIGLDVKRFEKDLRDANGRLERIISTDQKNGSRIAKVRGTPSLYVNGWKLSNRSVEGIRALVAKSRASSETDSSGFQRVLTKAPR